MCDASVTSVTSVTRPLRSVSIPDTGRYFWYIPVFLVCIPVLINLGGYFDYSPGCIPVNGTHCGFTADRAQGRRAAPGFGSASAFRIVYRITAIFAHFAASRRQIGATEKPQTIVFLRPASPVSARTQLASRVR